MVSSSDSPMQPKPELLIIEDEEPIIQGLIDVFIFHGYRVDTAMDGLEGLDKALAANML